MYQEQVVTLGYAQRGASERLEAFLCLQEKVCVVDIRLSPRSRWNPIWNKNALIERTGERYLHLPELGNRNYNQPGEPIVLADPVKGLESLLGLLQDGFAVLLLCACKEYGRCHRKVVYDLLVSVCGFSEKGGTCANVVSVE